MSCKTLLYLATFITIADSIGFLILWKKISKSYFKCSRCGNIYQPSLYKPTGLTFGSQLLTGKLYMLFFFWLPVFFGKALFQCPGCKKITWHTLEGSRKGVVWAGIGVILGSILGITGFLISLLICARTGI